MTRTSVTEKFSVTIKNIIYKIDLSNDEADIEKSLDLPRESSADLTAKELDSFKSVFDMFETYLDWFKDGIEKDYGYKIHSVGSIHLSMHNG